MLGLLLLLTPVSAFLATDVLAAAKAEGRTAVLAGGSGGESEHDFLLSDLRDLYARLSARGWDVRVAAGPSDGALPRSVKGTNANIKRAIMEAAEGGRSGDELLVVIHSHGRSREKEWGQQSHSIVSQDKDPSGAEPGLDLDALGPVLDTAAARGVRVALVDLSCYSGATQGLLKFPASCTATLAAADYVSFCSGRPEERHFSSRFLELPKPGTGISLEEQFLAARRADLDSVNLPQISSRATPARKSWNELLTTVDPLDVYEDLKNYRAGPKPFDPSRILAELPKNGSLIAELKTRLARLLATRARLESEVGGMAKASDDDTLELRLPGREPFKISPGNLADLLDHVEKPGDLDGYSDVQRRLIAQLAPALSSPALTSLAKPLADFRARKARFDSDEDALATDAGKAMDVERELYDLLARPVPDPAVSAACGTFAL